MPTSKPEVPNSAPGGDDPSSYKAKIDAGFNAQARLGWVFAPHAQDTPNMTVALAAGALLEGTTLTEVAAQSTGAITAPVTHPRIDRVVIDRATGAASVVAGTEAASPAPPAIPTGKLPVAQVLLAVGATAIVNANITDERVGGGAGVTIGSIDDPSPTEVPSTEDVAETIAAIPREDTTARDNAAMTALLAWLSAGRATGPVPGGALYTLKTDELTNSGATYDAAGDYYSNAATLSGTPHTLTAAMCTLTGFNSSDPTTLFDGSTTNTNIYPINGATAGNTHMVLDLGSPVALGKIEIYGYGSNQGPVIKAAYYDDGLSSWVDTSGSILSWAMNQWNPAIWNYVGAHRYWKFVNTGTNPSSANWCEVRGYAYGSVGNMTLTSAAVTLGQVPTKATMYLLHKAVDAVTLNTDIKVSASRGDGWAEATDLAVLCQFDSDYKLLRASVDLSALGTGNSASWRVQTYNTKAQRVRAALLWAE